MRVVLDTNVLVSALLFPGGAPEAVYRLGRQGRIELVSSGALLLELAQVLAVKFALDRDGLEDAIVDLAQSAEIVRPTERLRVIERDPADDRVLEAAAEGQAGVIVSGDRHLLELREWRAIRIVRPGPFLGELFSP